MNGYVASLRFLNTSPSTVHANARVGTSLPLVLPIRYGGRGLPSGCENSESKPV